MTLEQQENDEEINDEYRPATNGSDTSTPNAESNADNDDSVANGTTNLGNGVATSITGNGNGNGGLGAATTTTTAGATSSSTASATTSIPPNWNQSEKFPSEIATLSDSFEI